jgi:hypothetical protein
MEISLDNDLGEGIFAFDDDLLFQAHLFIYHLHAGPFELIRADRTANLIGPLQFGTSIRPGRANGLS